MTTTKAAIMPMIIIHGKLWCWAVWVAVGVAVDVIGVAVMTNVGVAVAVAVGVAVGVAVAVPTTIVVLVPATALK